LGLLARTVLPVVISDEERAVAVEQLQERVGQEVCNATGGQGRPEGPDENVFSVRPVTEDNPPIMTLVPGWTNPRLLMFESCESDSGSKSYSSTSPIPLVAFFPETIAVYPPGARVTTIADSKSFLGAMVLSSMSAC
jgi:hypothetical protein